MKTAWKIVQVITLCYVIYMGIAYFVVGIIH